MLIRLPSFRSLGAITSFSAISLSSLPLMNSRSFSPSKLRPTWLHSLGASAVLEVRIFLRNRPTRICPLPPSPSRLTSRACPASAAPNEKGVPKSPGAKADGFNQMPALKGALSFARSVEALSERSAPCAMAAPCQCPSGFSESRAAAGLPGGTAASAAISASGRVLRK